MLELDTTVPGLLILLPCVLRELGKFLALCSEMFNLIG